MKLPILFLSLLLIFHTYGQTYNNTHYGSGDIVNGDKVMGNKIVVLVDTTRLSGSNIAKAPCHLQDWGSVCFENNTKEEIQSFIQPGSSCTMLWNGRTQLSMSINDTQCAYSLSPGVYCWVVWSAQIGERKGTIIVEQCQTKTVSIR